MIGLQKFQFKHSNHGNFLKFHNFEACDTLKIKLKFFAKNYVLLHSSEIGGLGLMKYPREILQNLPYFYYKKTHSSFFHFLFIKQYLVCICLLLFKKFSGFWEFLEDVFIKQLSLFALGGIALFSF